MASSKQPESPTATRVILNFTCGHYRIWKVSAKGAAYLQSIYVQKGPTVEEGIVLTDQQPCYACRWLETLKRFYPSPSWEHDDVFPGDSAAAAAATSSDNKTGKDTAAANDNEKTEV
ncbi:hypothetical protein PG994_002995 [Apiospora phragmitis]|uniref:Uncharacterized protein n=1 Tax=Apiospora phragmitis TaxID=2905665 RepID=A0ABR1WAL4_9PEZI